MNFPTVLIVLGDSALRNTLFRTLRSQGYAVLEAVDEPAALAIIRTHSRHIHVLVTDDSANSRHMAAVLKQYRPYMQIVFMTLTSDDSSQDPKALALTLDRIREVLGPPRNQEGGQLPKVRNFTHGA
jgi:CheY-like chemotaxis protein